MNNASLTAAFSARTVEATVAHNLERILSAGAPPLLARAMRHAVLGGGSRFRPRLLLAVAASCGTYDRTFADCAAAAVEFLHCASLVHDDLPAFDGADVRRSAPTVHRMFGEATAILTGDALIVAAYEILLAGVSHHPRGVQAMKILLRAGGAHSGLAKGQAMELEPVDDVASYHHAKTGVLFEAAAGLGALAADAEAEMWMRVGRELGALYQVLDDLLDVYGDADKVGKPLGQDTQHGRPSVLGVPDEPKSAPRLVSGLVNDELQPRVRALRAAIPPGAVLLEAFVSDVLDTLNERFSAPLPHAEAG